jgi:ABC-type spermidine/putrescine transport system permease subunit I
MSTKILSYFVIVNEVSTPENMVFGSASGCVLTMITIGMTAVSVQRKGYTKQSRRFSFL